MKKLGILVSGRGSNMVSIIEACEQGKISATVEIVISNNKNAIALERAHAKGIKTVYLDSNINNAEQIDHLMQTSLTESAVDYVLLAGYMKKIGQQTLSVYSGKILNIHPSLLPKFGGQGMYGMHVHKAVIAAGESESGVTIHLVNDEYDDGAILAQGSVQVEPNDTSETLAARVLELEHELYPETIQKILDGSIILPE